MDRGRLEKDLGESRFARAVALGRGDGVRRSLPKFVAELRRAAEAGHADAQLWLGSLLEEGLVDKLGHVLVRKNRALARRWYEAAAEQGHAGALLNLGVLIGETDETLEGRALELGLYRRAYRADPSCGAATNIACVYRDRGEPAAAVRWWKKSVAAGNPGSWVDLGYAYRHGIGLRRSSAQAERCFERALRAPELGAWEREEAMYHLAEASLSGPEPAARAPTRRRRSSARARALLAQASADGDFGEAVSALESLLEAGSAVFCVCRRGRAGPWPGNAPCPRHP